MSGSFSMTTPIGLNSDFFISQSSLSACRHIANPYSCEPFSSSFVFFNSSLYVFGDPAINTFAFVSQFIEVSIALATTVSFCH
jgi:hypothetical protein